MSSSKDADNTVAFAGVEGANADLACRQKHPYMVTHAYPTFEDVFDAVERGEAKYGMIPIENSRAGRVAEIHNLLPDTDLHIVDEYILPVEHHLFGAKGATLEDIRQVYSHPQALMQCRENLRSEPFEAVPYADTALAGKDVAAWNNISKAALCSKLAGEIYHLELLREHMEDHHDNRTLFITVAREPADPDPSKEKVLTSALFIVRSIPAALYKSLGGFATNGINLIKLESYIGQGMSESAQFFITFEGHPDEKPVQLAMQELGYFSKKVKVLGVYPADPSRIGQNFT